MSKRAVVAPRTWYKLHRWIGALVGLQMLAWTLGGVIFSWHPIAAIRGSSALRLERPQVDVSAVHINLGDAVKAAHFTGSAEEEPARLDTVQLRPYLGGVVYELHAGEQAAIIDATTGRLRSPIDEASARRVALSERREPAKVIRATLLTANPPTEFRGRPLPAWQLQLDDDEQTAVYVDARTGKVTARRNDAWRRFDWFWMLHTMDYGGRDNFHTLWLQAAAWLTLLGLLSGYGLWWIRLRRRRGR